MTGSSYIAFFVLLLAALAVYGICISPVYEIRSRRKMPVIEEKGEVIMELMGRDIEKTYEQLGFKTWQKMNM